MLSLLLTKDNDSNDKAEYWQNEMKCKGIFILRCNLLIEIILI